MVYRYFYSMPLPGSKSNGVSRQKGQDTADLPFWLIWYILDDGSENAVLVKAFCNLFSGEAL